MKLASETNSACGTLSSIYWGLLSACMWFIIQGKAIRTGGEFVDMDTPLEKINLHVRAGHILPWQKPESNTHYRWSDAASVLIPL